MVCGKEKRGYRSMPIKDDDGSVAVAFQRLMKPRKANLLHYAMTTTVRAIMCSLLVLLLVGLLPIIVLV